MLHNFALGNLPISHSILLCDIGGIIPCKKKALIVRPQALSDNSHLFHVYIHVVHYSINMRNNSVNILEVVHVNKVAN